MSDLNLGLKELDACPSPNHLGICGRRVLSFLIGGSFTILTDFSFFLIENSAPRSVRPNRASKPLERPKASSSAQ